MSRRFIVTATDTDVGKTVFSAALTQALSGTYFKPVQAGLGDTDLETVKRLTGLPDKHFVPEIYRLNTHASPHRAAEIDGISINPERLILPDIAGPLIVEGAGGLLVPLTRDCLFIDVFRNWRLPVVLCVRTVLGTINHSLLSLEALHKRDIPVHGVVFMGEENRDTERTIVEMGRVRHLGRFPRLQVLDREHVREAFARHFNAQDFSL